MPEAARRSTNLVAVAVALAAVVVVLGAYTRLVDAGLGCPDWPGCYGMILVPETAEEIARAEAAFPGSPVEVDKAWPEMIHRYAAALLGLVVLMMTVLAVKQGLPWKLPVALVLLVIAQGAFGAWTVTLKLWPQVVTTHLLGGFATLALLWMWWLGLRDPPWRVDPSLRGLSMTTLVVVVIQVALGGWLTANYAALACPDFPTCHGVWIPDMDFAAGFDIFQDVGPNYLGGLMSSDARVAIHVVHRLGAVAVLLFAGALAVRLGSRPLAGVLAGVLGVQLALGIANVVFALPLAVAVLHNAGAAALLLVVVTVNYSIRRTGA
ncbi:MAG: COX15/CtaA family protein [Gammaproteobacteria bacterium]|nr:COX15/CtaA family protein [Gammaproteobacteria bacterium]MDE0443379.1 COX15/CtaA family protein [Gammaproteobacteria bacterium]